MDEDVEAEDADDEDDLDEDDEAEDEGEDVGGADRRLDSGYKILERKACS